MWEESRDEAFISIRDLLVNDVGMGLTGHEMSCIPQGLNKVLDLVALDQTT